MQLPLLVLAALPLSLLALLSGANAGPRSAALSCNRRRLKVNRHVGVGRISDSYPPLRESLINPCLSNSSRAPCTASVGLAVRRARVPQCALRNTLNTCSCPCMVRLLPRSTGVGQVRGSIGSSTLRCHWATGTVPSFKVTLGISCR